MTATRRVEVACSPEYQILLRLLSRLLPHDVLLARSLVDSGFSMAVGAEWLGISANAVRKRAVSLERRLQRALPGYEMPRGPVGKTVSWDAHPALARKLVGGE